MVPLLCLWAYPAMGIAPEIIVHLSFGTSLAIIIPTSLSSSWAHSRTGNVDWRIVFLLAVPGIAGSLLGSTLAAHSPGRVLKILFGCLLVITSGQMIRQKKGAEAQEILSLPRVLPTLFIGFLVGLFSAFFGLGGGVIAVPLMIRFLGIPIHRAVGISIAFVFFASLIGTAGYIFNGWGQPHLPPFALGYIFLPGWVLAGIPSVFTAPWGAKVARKTKPSRLRRAFALLLMIVGIRMLF